MAMEFVAGISQVFLLPFNAQRLESCTRIAGKLFQIMKYARPRYARDLRYRKPGSSW